nr:RNA-directed DNA methylation 4 isoform X2 [Ipomoea batatas]
MAATAEESARTNKAGDLLGLSESIAILPSMLSPDSADSSIIKEKFEERRRAFKANNHMQRQDQLLTKAKQKQEDLSKSARFEQVWKSRRGKKEDEALHEVCRLYDVVRVDTEEKSHDVQEEDPELEDHKMMSQYLPFLREVMPSAAEEIESDIHDYIFKQGSALFSLFGLEGFNESCIVVA